MYGVPDFYQNDNVKKRTGMQWRHQVVSDLPSNAPNKWSDLRVPAGAKILRPAGADAL